MKGNAQGVRDPQGDETYADVYLEHRSLEQNTAKSVRTAWGHLETFLEQNSLVIEEFGEKEAKEFYDYLKLKDGVSQKTGALYARHLSKLTSWYVDRGKFDYNPFAMALEDMPFEYSTETTKAEIPIRDLRSALRSLSPLMLVTLVLLLKTGVRLSEAVNLDERDVHLDHPVSKRLDDPRPEIRDKPDTLYIDSSISKGEVHNGEKRNAGNKPNSYRAIPIDPELKDTLVWWFAMAPPSPSPANPVIRNNQKSIGHRYSPEWIDTLIRRVAKENGFYAQEHGQGFTAHWCRHWFTTMLRSNIEAHEVPVGSPSGYVAGLRGDTGGEVIETYTHDWSETVNEENKSYREVYEDNIPQLLVKT